MRTETDFVVSIYKENSSFAVFPTMEGNVSTQRPPFEEEITPSMVPVSSTQKPVAIALPIKCLHGVLVNNSRNRTVCVRRYGGIELRNLSTWLVNQTLNITSENFTYYRKNCTNVIMPYFWNGVEYIVNSSHSLTCSQITAWPANDGWKFH